MPDAKEYFISRGCVDVVPAGVVNPRVPVISVTSTFKTWMEQQGFSLYSGGGTIQEWGIYLEEVEIGRVVRGWNE
jgi:hypothetical protein